jgi:hypothetical protein
MMAYIDPARRGNEYQALHPETSHPDFGNYHGTPRPKRKRIRNLIMRVLGRSEKRDE